MKSFKTFLEQLHLEIYNQGLDDKWIRDDVTVTLKQLLDVTKNIPVENIPTDKLKEIVLNWQNNPEEIEKIEKSDLQYPVLIIVSDNNKIKYVLDGNHRVQKSIKNDLPFVKSKLIKISELPEDFQYVLEDLKF